MDDQLIEQAVYGSEGTSGYRFLAKSPGFLDNWQSPAQQLCTAFGERPAGVACPLCVFAQPFGPRHVAVVQVADHGRDDAGRPGTLRFRLLIVPQNLYTALEGDPFLIADAYPPPWDTKESLPALTWTAGAPPKRTVAMLEKVLNVPNSATLLGAAQALVDGSHVVFARSEPDASILRNLWALLPSSSRCELWPATFAFGNVEAFNAVAVPTALAPTDPQWIHEDQAGDYPEGRYELNLQIAVETGNQRDLDHLLARKTRWHMIKLAAVMVIVLLGIFLLVPVIMDKFGLKAPAPRSTPPPALSLPPKEECPPLSDRERHDLAAKLQELAERLHIKDVPGGDSDQELTETLAALDAKLPAPEPKRDHQPLYEYGPIQRQLRALLWSRGVADYNKPQPNTVELAEKLESHLVKERQP
jgi:hypothetical protein